MKKGEGCKNLYTVQTPAVHGEGHNKAKHRCCEKLGGFMLKNWRCVGKDSPDCPGFTPKSNQIEDRGSDA